MGPRRKGFFAGLFEPGAPGQPKPPPKVAQDDDFADFAKAPEPTPAAYQAATAVASDMPTLATPDSNLVPYTAWYRVWERTQPSDFYQEMAIVPFILFIVGLHAWGRRKNRRMARQWIESYAPALEKEFATVGFSKNKPVTADDVQQEGLLKASLASSQVIPPDLLKEKTAQEFTTYATGRQNVAFVDITLKLFKRYNPLTLILEIIMSFFFETVNAPMETMTAVMYTFDGREKDLVHVPSQKEQDALESRVKNMQSSYDGFVWAIVHKEGMRHLREDRYDISFTSTKDSANLPPWATIMSESAEITNTLLTPELISAVEKAGDECFRNLIITDQPIDKPYKLNETVPKKRLSLTLKLPSSPSQQTYAPTMPLMSYFFRLPDILVSQAHFRPEVMRKVKSTREEEIRKLKKIDDDEKAEERRTEEAKRKKEEREGKLKGMSAEEQRKFLEKEREREQKKNSKRMTKRA
ncbi:hypothetical protein MMC25_006986 [Agyrium rufum]|nr:hypothetical protein [Agyrium rufum]